MSLFARLILTPVSKAFNAWRTVQGYVKNDPVLPAQVLAVGVSLAAIPVALALFPPAAPLAAAAAVPPAVAAAPDVVELQREIVEVPASPDKIIVPDATLPVAIPGPREVVHEVLEDAGEERSELKNGAARSLREHPSQNPESGLIQALNTVSR
jgi:hypothetical protein